MMASIIIISGELKGECLPLGHRTNVIGRGETVSLQVLDESVSRKHLRITFDDSSRKHFAEDMQSRHGVCINGRKITEPTALCDGDEILIGQTTLLFTEKDFDDLESALSHYKKQGENVLRTRTDHC